MAAIHVASDSMYHECMKHIKAICHFVHEKVAKKEIHLKYACTKDQIAIFFL